MFDWREFLELANRLGGAYGTSVSVALSEAASRSAVSRAHYAAFCHARNYAQQNLGYVSRGTSADHAAVRQHYQMLGMTSVTDGLDRLRRWRNLCDYQDSVRNLGTVVANALAEAAAVIQQS